MQSILEATYQSTFSAHQQKWEDTVI